MTSSLVVLGFFIWWSIRETRVSRIKFEQELSTSGLSFKLPDLCKRTAFLTAVRTIKQKSHGHKLLIRVLLKDGEQHLFGLVDETVDPKAKTLEYHHSATLRFDQKTHEVSCDVKHRAFDLVKAEYERNLYEMNSYDLRRVIMQMIEALTPISPREGGGIYYVPYAHKDVLEKIQTLINNIGCRMDVVSLYDEEKSRNAIYNAFVEDVTHKLEVFQKDIDSDKFSTAKGWSSTIDRFKEMKDQVEFYADKLRFAGDNIMEKISKMEEQVKERMLGL